MTRDEFVIKKVIGTTLQPHQYLEAYNVVECRCLEGDCPGWKTEMKFDSPIRECRSCGAWHRAPVNEMPCTVTKDQRLEKESLPSKWMAIATAPKDGTIILACGDSFIDRLDFGKHPRAVVWSRFHGKGSDNSAWRNINGNKEENLTHWMDLPDPPEES